MSDATPAQDARPAPDLELAAIIAERNQLRQALILMADDGNQEAADHLDNIRPARLTTPKAAPDLAAADSLVRDILESLCRRDGLPVESAVVPGGPARNYELAIRLGIGHVFGLAAATPAQPAPDLAAAIDPSKLDLLADWFDNDDAIRGRPGNPEVQADLRRWAKAVRDHRKLAGLPS